jgi:uncharacterized protein (DUF58 family)
MPEGSGTSEAVLLTPRAAALARELEFFARTRVEGFLKSSNPSRRKGQSTDFLQHRQYMPGDDLRTLDWRVFARSDRLVTREYEEHTNLDVVICLDASGSMGYGRAGIGKMEFCRRCIAMLCYLLLMQRDTFGWAAMAGGVTQFVRPASSRRHLALLFQRLVGAEAGGATDFAACTAELVRQVRRRSVFVVFSDGYQDPEALTRALGTLVAQRHDVIFYQCYDPDEKELPFAGFTVFRDLEDGGLDAADPMEIRSAYRAVFAAHTERLRRGAARHGIEFHSLPVSEEWDLVLARLLRERMGAR